MSCCAMLCWAAPTWLAHHCVNTDRMLQLLQGNLSQSRRNTLNQKDEAADMQQAADYVADCELGVH